MSASSATTQRRLAEGASNICAHSHHDRCSGPPCTCQCHTDPLFEATSTQGNTSEGARRAWVTRRRRKAADQDQDQGASSPRATGETAPKRPDLKSGAKAAVSAAAAKQIKSEFALALWAADAGAATLAPKLWTTPEDRLQEGERTALVNATYNELEARCPALLKILAKAQESATEATLLYVLAMIAAPRLARHGVIPNELASAIVFAPVIAQSVSSREPTPAGVGAESTPKPDRANGHGQIDVSESFAQGSPVQAGASQQAGYGDLQHGQGDPDSPRNGRYAA